jgi:zinc/manganese transport system substrate-binding protein
MRSEPAAARPARRRGVRAAALYSLAAVLLLGSAPLAHALTVFACEPEWAALVRILAPDAQVVSATHARQDPHHVEARPALIVQLRRADLAVCTGASLESGWLPLLQQRAGNPKVRDGEPGMFHAADEVELIDPQPGFAGPFAGDVHAEGNPHVHADPRRLLEVARGLARRLAEVDPARASDVGTRLARFETEWTARIEAWQRQATPLRGRVVAAQHGTFAYLWRWLGIVQAVDLEPRPGMAPTPGHLQRVLAQLRSAPPPMAIVAAQYQDPRPARWLAAQLGERVPVLLLPATVPDDAAPDALGAWIEGLLRALLDAAR